MHKPTAADLLHAAASRWWMPIWLTQWLWTWCPRCDKVVTRWHYRSCPCLVYEVSDGKSKVQMYLTADVADAAIQALLDRFDRGGQR